MYRVRLSWAARFILGAPMTTCQKVISLAERGYSTEFIARSLNLTEGQAKQFTARFLTGGQLDVAAECWAAGYDTEQIAQALDRPEHQVANSLPRIKTRARRLAA